MITLAQLTGAHRRTYLKIFSNLTSTEVRRSEVRSLLETLGVVSDAAENGLNVNRNGHVLALSPVGSKKIETADTLIALQHFLKRSENPIHDSNGREAHFLLVIGHHEARLFRSEIYGGFPQQILPHETHGRLTLAESLGEKTSEADTSFEPIAEALQATGEILIFGESSATQVEMDRFIGWLKQRHPQLAERIIGSLVLDEDQAGSGVLLEKARDFYANAHPEARSKTL